MAENYEFISAANLPTTDAKEVDVICVEGGELKRKPGASIGGGGGYVVRLPADTQMQMGDDGSVTFVAVENRDNFAEMMYNGGNVIIDASATPLAQSMGISLAMLAPAAWGFDSGVLLAVVTTNFNGQQMSFSIIFPNGTWEPPTAE